jgi:hypothetical protein
MIHSRVVTHTCQYLSFTFIESPVCLLVLLVITVIACTNYVYVISVVMWEYMSTIHLSVCMIYAASYLSKSPYR